MLSYLFSRDVLLQSIADDDDRISRTQHSDDPAVGKLQFALLLWDALALPTHGADGQYGDETAGAVARFKQDELGVPPAQIVDDVGPRTVVRLDEIAAAAEGMLDLGTVLIATPGLTSDDQAALQAELEQAGATVLLGLGEVAAVIGGGQTVVDALTPLLGGLLAGLLSPADPQLPAALDEETITLLEAWLAMLDPVFILSQTNPNRFGAPFEPLGGCVLEFTP